MTPRSTSQGRLSAVLVLFSATMLGLGCAGGHIADEGAGGGDLAQGSVLTGGHHDGSSTSSSSSTSTSSSGVVNGTGSSSSTSSSSSSSGVGSTTSSGGTSSGGACNYPSGQPGTSQGSVVNKSDAWQGFAQGMSSAGNISIADYLDCDGSKGINAVLIDMSGVSCPACQAEAQDFPGKLADWNAKGIRVLTLILDDANGNPATLQNAQTWRQTYGLDGIAVAADPSGLLLPNDPSGVGLPYQILLDPRTMTIAGIEQGYSGDDSALLALAAKNAH